MEVSTIGEKQVVWQLRPIQKKDNAIVAKIIRETMTQFGCVGEGYAYVDPELDDMYTAFSGERSKFWVLENDEGKVVGCGGIAALKNGSPDTCELQKLYFLEAARGKGFGRKLTDLCLQAAKELGYKKCYLETVERMTIANAMYQKMGFQKIDGNMGNTGHCGCDSYYVKEL
ncbi:MAG: GNAT family N-acetyltransferase [Bacteroidota bacterium]